MREQQTDNVDAESTRWIVIRPQGHIAGSELASVYEGEWRDRGDLDRADYLELDGPQGRVRAYPTDRVEMSSDGRHAQVWVVPGDTGVSDMQGGADDPHQDDSRDHPATGHTDLEFDHG